LFSLLYCLPLFSDFIAVVVLNRATLLDFQLSGGVLTRQGEPHVWTEIVW